MIKRFLFSSALACVLSQGGFAQSAVYELHPLSDFQVGCLPPCLCPILLHDDLEGSFVLKPEPFGPLNFSVYSVELARFTFSGSFVSGFGTYLLQNNSTTPLHQMTLELSIDGEAPRTFESGMVLGGSSFPMIDIAVAVNDFVCFDEVFRIVALPTVDEVGGPYCFTTANSSGRPAEIFAFGSPAIADNDLTLAAFELPGVTFGLFFFGDVQTQSPFGNGIRCAGGSVHRISLPIATDQNGAVSRVLDLSAPPATGTIVPGATQNFQLWFRDVAGGGAGFNLTNGREILFQ